MVWAPLDLWPCPDGEARKIVLERSPRTRSTRAAGA